ncbi:MAG: hypothetical protein KGV56_00975 [Gammaproteobacteria bacterium]|nr:hypothetical protein [Gammaproteobacteria bacterium]
MQSNIYAPPKADLTRQHQPDKITSLVVEYLETAGKWAKVLSVIGYLAAIAICCYELWFIFEQMRIRFDGYGLFGGIFSGMGIMSLYSFILDILVFTLSFFTYKTARALWRYAVAIGQLSESYEKTDLINVQKNFCEMIKQATIALSLLMSVIFISVINLNFLWR